jgi:hypothetical protein
LAQEENQYVSKNQEVSRKATGGLSAQDEKPNILNAITKVSQAAGVAPLATVKNYRFLPIILLTSVK